MKKIIILCAGILGIGAVYLVWMYAQPEHFGQSFSNVPIVSIAQLTEKPVEGYFRVEGKIVRQCPMSGCWFYLDDGKGHQVRIDFGKILPQLPQRVGRTAVVEGQLAKTSQELMLIGSAVEFR
jgi:cytochrome c-type biogenesis protein CcmE